MGLRRLLQETMAWFADVLGAWPEPPVPSATLSGQSLTVLVLPPHGLHMAGLLPNSYSSTIIPTTAQ